LSYKFSETKLKKYSLFSIGSKKFGYGHFSRIENLISTLNKKNKKFSHYSYGDQLKNKKNFLDKINYELELKRYVILDLTNHFFLNKTTRKKLKKIFSKKKLAKVIIIDAPIKKNLSTFLDLNYSKTLIPFDITKDLENSFKKIKKKKIGSDYFIYPYKNIVNEKKQYDIILSFGASDNYKGTLYVLKLLEILKLKRKILVVFGKYFKENYKIKILEICKKNKFSSISFSKNFSNILNKSRLLITNSGLTKYQGVLHGLKVIVFSDTRESQKIDKMFIKKTKQFNFPSSRSFDNDVIILKKILQNKLNFKTVKKKNFLPNIKKIKDFFK
tara:strand:+ start:704 stop:1690 length:987 start_codon:yes stop_codon:yes gene_type:complete